MRPTPQRVIIYNLNGSMSQSVVGTTEMFTNNLTQSETGLSFEVETMQGQSLTGLTNALFVIGGGNALMMMRDISHSFTPEVVNNNKFLGICAGAILCCQQSQIPAETGQRRYYFSDLPLSLAETAELVSQSTPLSLGLLPIKATAPCYPEKITEDTSHQIITSVMVASSFCNTIPREQLFIAGPQFEINANNFSTHTLATYNSTGTPAWVANKHMAICGYHPEAAWLPFLFNQAPSPWQYTPTATGWLNNPFDHAGAQAHTRGLLAQTFRLFNNKRSGPEATKLLPPPSNRTY